jgi:AAA domain/Winged helix-turn-helix DNA-binding
MAARISSEADLKTISPDASGHIPELRRPSRQRGPASLTTHSGLEVYNSEFAAPEAIIDRLLYPGLTIFVARPKAGKSWLALQIAVAIASGAALGGSLRVNRTGRVLYLALEESQARTAPRLRKLTAGGDYLGKVDFVYSVEALMSGGARQIDSFLADHPCALVVIDTYFAIAKRAGRKDMDILQGDYNTINALREIAERHRTAILLIHHARKADGDGVDVVLGTSGISAACDAIWSMKRSSQGDCVLTVRGREMEEMTYGLRFGDEPFGWQITGAGEEALLTKQRREIVDLLRKEGPLPPKSISEKLGKNGTTVRRLLQKLAAGGAVSKNGEAYSAPTESNEHQTPAP